MKRENTDKSGRASESTDKGPLAALVAKQRAALGLSLYELEGRCNVNRAKLMRIEKGEIRCPTIETLHKLANGLDTDPDPLLDAAAYENPHPLPSLPTYLRLKLNLDDNQVDAIVQHVNQINESPKAA